MYGYIYMVTNNINGKRYIGKKSSKVFCDDYYGSGSLIIRAIAKYGKENFSKTVLEWCESREILNERERYWIKFYNAVEDPMFYNLAPGGDGFDKGMRFTEQHKQNISKSMSGSNNPMYGKEPNEDQIKGLEIGRHLPASDKLKKTLSEIRTNVVVSDSTRKALSEKAKNRHYVNDGKNNKLIYDWQMDEYINVKGWKIGRVKNW